MRDTVRSSHVLPLLALGLLLLPLTAVAEGPVAGLRASAPAADTDLPFTRVLDQASRGLPEVLELNGLDRLVQPSAELQQAGIAWYAITGTRQGAEVLLLGSAGYERGALSVQLTPGGMTFSADWLDDAIGAAVMQAAWRDLRMQMRNDPAKETASPAFTAAEVTALVDTTCNYSYRYSGGGWSTKASIACEEARLELSNNCTNPYCIGCCEYLPCDCMCLKDDGGCYCEMEGYACNPNTCEYDWEMCDEPDPILPGGGGGGGGGGDDGGSGSGGGGYTCVDVTCNGEYAGEACGYTTEEIVERAWNMC